MIKKEIKKHNFSPIEKYLTWEQAFTESSTITTTGTGSINLNYIPNTLTISPEFREVISEELIKLLEENRSR